MVSEALHHTPTAAPTNGCADQRLRRPTPTYRRTHTRTHTIEQGACKCACANIVVGARQCACGHTPPAPTCALLMLWLLLLWLLLLLLLVVVCFTPLTCTRIRAFTNTPTRPASARLCPRRECHARHRAGRQRPRLGGLCRMAGAKVQGWRQKIRGVHTGDGIGVSVFV